MHRHVCNITLYAKPYGAIHNMQYTTYTTQHTLHNIHYTTYTTQHTLHNIHYTTYSIVSFGIIVLSYLFSPIFRSNNNHEHTNEGYMKELSYIVLCAYIHAGTLLNYSAITVLTG